MSGPTFFNERAYLSHIIEKQVNASIEAQVKAGLLKELREEMRKEFEVRLEKLEALDEVIKNLKVLFK